MTEHPPPPGERRERPYEPTRDIGEILAWADKGTTPVKIRGRLARVQRWLRITPDADADRYVNRLRIMLPAFALQVVEQLDADELAERLDEGEAR